MKAAPKYYVIVNIILSMKILADLKPEEISMFIISCLYALYVMFLEFIFSKYLHVYDTCKLKLLCYCRIIKLYTRIMNKYKIVLK